MITIKKVDITIETAYQLYELGFIIYIKNNEIHLGKEV